MRNFAAQSYYRSLPGAYLLRRKIVAKLAENAEL
jgi:hypothetical protein